MSSKYNYSYFSKVNLKTCYWAGYLAGNSSIHLRGDNNYKLTICAANRYVANLKRFCTDLNLPKDMVKQPKGHYRIDLGNQDLIKDLIKNFNLALDKHKNLTLPNLNNPSLTKAYIVGYLEGSGSIYFVKSGKKTKSIKLSISLNQALLISIYDFFKQEYQLKFKGNIFSQYHTTVKGIKLYKLRIIGKEAARILVDLHKLPIDKSSKWYKLDGAYFKQRYSELFKNI